MSVNEEQVALNAWDEMKEEKSLFLKSLSFFISSPTTFLGSALIFIFVFSALFAPLIAPYDPVYQDLNLVLRPPDATYWLGTDPFGRDVLSRIIFGARLSLAIGVVSVAIGLVTGVALGLVAGYFGGRLDNLVMRLIDIMLAFPSILLAILLVAILGMGVGNIMVSIGIYSMPNFARLVRSSTIAIKENEFIEGAHASGCGTFLIIVRHILPNIMGPIIVQSTFLVATAIRLASGLSFLGIGVPPPTPEWGSMLADARGYISLAPHLIILPGVALMMVILAFNLLGDGLRDFMDPKTIRRR